MKRILFWKKNIVLDRCFLVNAKVNLLKNLPVYCRGQELFVGALRDCKHSAVIAQLIITTLPYGIDSPQKCRFQWASGPI